ncbi:MAG: lipoyl(octanoyl) transferase LipB [Thermaerobacter sp.]|nr:lipoyl(octanoyl) transferase LipB [Thermaerobacter sp.]
MHTRRCRPDGCPRCPSPPLSDALLLRPGRLPYGEASDLQRRLHAARAAGQIPDVLLLLEHPSVFTIGRKGTPEEVLASPERLRALGVDVYETDRGGRVTYHGPGQVIGYPIVDLTSRGGDVVRFVRDLEKTLIRVVLRFGVPGEQVAGLSGVWVGQDKLAAIGVRVAENVTMHGFALNSAVDLSLFGEIIPCGIQDRGVTSLRALLGEEPPQDLLLAAITEEMARTFGWNYRAPKPSEDPLLR